MNTETIIPTINALPRGSALFDHHAYVFHRDDDPEQPEQLLVDIVAWRTRSQEDEDRRWHHVDHLIRSIETLPGVSSVKQVGNIDHENGRGWTYEVTLA